MSTVQKKKCQARSLASKSSSARVLIVRQKVSSIVVVREWVVRLQIIPRRVVNEKKRPQEKGLKRCLWFFKFSVSRLKQSPRKVYELSASRSQSAFVVTEIGDAHSSRKLAITWVFAFERGFRSRVLSQTTNALKIRKRWITRQPRLTQIHCWALLQFILIFYLLNYFVVVKGYTYMAAKNLLTSLFPVNSIY